RPRNNARLLTADGGRSPGSSRPDRAKQPVRLLPTRARTRRPGGAVIRPVCISLRRSRSRSRAAHAGGKPFLQEDQAPAIAAQIAALALPQQPAIPPPSAP